MTLVKLKNRNGLWLFVAPVSGLILPKDIGEEFTVNKITFVSKNKLPRIRIRLGFPMTIGALKTKISHFKGNFFENARHMPCVS